MILNEYKNIDIFIRNSKGQAIIVENKIYAEDQEQQLARYYQEIINEGYSDITIIYLTLDGKEPEEQSIEGIPKEFIESDKFMTLSYEYQIQEWIKNCTKEAALTPEVREVLQQYSQLISRY